MNFEALVPYFEKALSFYEYLTKATPAVLSLGALLVFYYREKIKALLATSLAREVEKLKSDFAKDLAAHTASLQRELEAYKVSLIADAERIKASQDVRKSIALKVAERRFNAIAKLLDIQLGIDSTIGAFATTPRSTEPVARDRFLQVKQELISRLSEYSAASAEAQIFLSAEIRGRILKVREAALATIGLRLNIDTPEVDKDHPVITSLLQHSLELENDLRELLEEIEAA